MQWSSGAKLMLPLVSRRSPTIKDRNSDNPTNGGIFAITTSTKSNWRSSTIILDFPLLSNLQFKPTTVKVRPPAIMIHSSPQHEAPKTSSRLKECVPIGYYRLDCDNPQGRRQYHVGRELLKEWGGLSVKDGWLQRSAYITEFENAERFLNWFRPDEKNLIARNN